MCGWAGLIGPREDKWTPGRRLFFLALLSSPAQMRVFTPHGSSCFRLAWRKGSFTVFKTPKTDRFFFPAPVRDSHL